MADRLLVIGSIDMRYRINRTWKIFRIPPKYKTSFFRILVAALLLPVSIRMAMEMELPVRNPMEDGLPSRYVKSCLGINLHLFVHDSIFFLSLPLHCLEYLLISLKAYDCLTQCHLRRQMYVLTMHRPGELK